MNKARINEFQQRYQQDGLVELRYLGVHEILVSQIKGSVNRWQHFDRRFLSADADNRKLKSILNAVEQGIPLPPIEVYKVKDDYYVIDGNHRVAVARQTGQIYIDAEIMELLPPGDSLEHLLWREKAAFELQTGLSLNFTEHGSYHLLLNYIKEYHQQKNQSSGSDISLKEACRSWRSEIYQPLITILDRSRLDECFPENSRDDLFLYILHHQLTKAKLQGREVGIKEAVAAFGDVHPSQLEPVIAKIFKGLVFRRPCTDLCCQCRRKCPEGLVCLADGRMQIDQKCTGCGLCDNCCPENNLVAYETLAQNPPSI